jgi:hypothetical protein
MRVSYENREKCNNFDSRGEKWYSKRELYFFNNMLMSTEKPEWQDNPYSTYENASNPADKDALPADWEKVDSRRNFEGEKPKSFDVERRNDTLNGISSKEKWDKATDPPPTDREIELAFIWMSSEAEAKQVGNIEWWSSEIASYS